MLGAVMAGVLLALLSASACRVSPTRQAAPVASLSGADAAEPAAFQDETLREEIGANAALTLTAFTAKARASAAVRTAIAMRTLRAGAPVEPFLEFAVDSVPGSELAAQAAYLLGGVQLNSGEASAAVRTLQPYAADGSELGPYLRAQYAAALDAANDRKAAASQWETLLALPALPRTLEVEAVRARADESTDAITRAAYLQRAVNLTGSPADRWALAQAARAGGDEATFRKQAVAVVERNPESPQAVEAIAALHAANIAVDPGDEALVDYRHQDYAGVEKLLTPAVVDARGITDEQRTFRLYYLGAAYEDEGKASEAIAAYDGAATTGASGEYVHRARYWAAVVMQSTWDYRAAAARFAALAEQGPPGEFTSEAAFQAGFLLLEHGDAAGALRTWDGLGTTYDSRVLYWKGRAALAVGDAAAAQSAFSAAAKAGPFDFYAIEASIQLGRSSPPNVQFQQRKLTSPDWNAAAAWLAQEAGPGSIPAVSTAAGELAGLGLRDQAVAAIDDAAEAANAWQLLGLAREAYNAGLYDASSAMVARLIATLGLGDAEVPAAILRLEYPVAYTPGFDLVAQTNGIDPLFLAAVIYQESAWNSMAGSTAGALGLLQLIPATGNEVGKQLGFGDLAAADLFQPGLNLAIGARYLGQQLRAFGDPAVALAAYNAGPGNAARWEKAWDHADAATFAGVVDFAETQSYVAQIYEWYALYEAAYG